MLFAFAGIIYLGHMALSILVCCSIFPCLMNKIFALQLKSFHEIISIAHVRYKENKLPWFRTLNWLDPLLALSFTNFSSDFFFFNFLANTHHH